MSGGTTRENHTEITRNALAPATVGKQFTYSPDRGASVGADASYRWMRASLVLHVHGAHLPDRR